MDNMVKTQWVARSVDQAHWTRAKDFLGSAQFMQRNLSHLLASFEL